MHIVICEDTINDQDILDNLIKSWAESKKIDIDLKKYESAEKFLFELPDIKVDIIFLDIELKKGGMNGIDLSMEIRKSEPNTQIIFTTGHKQYSLYGYDAYPLHFLVKPLVAEKLFSVLDKAHYLMNSYEKDTVILANGIDITKLQASKIYYIRMKSHFAELNMNNKKFMLRKTTEELLEILPAHFFRCHRSYIVNLLQVNTIYYSYLILSTGAKIPISRGALKRVKEEFMRFNILC